MLDVIASSGDQLSSLVIGTKSAVSLDDYPDAAYLELDVRVVIVTLEPLSGPA